jgi:hypothetical protein
MGETAQTETERLLSDTYRHLFSQSPSAQPLRADYVGGQLVVQSGQHRALAAQAAQVPVLPVHVAADDATRLAEIEAACTREVRALGGFYNAVPSLHSDRETALYREHQPVEPVRRGR